MSAWNSAKYSRIQMVVSVAITVFMTSLVWFLLKAQQSSRSQAVPEGAKLTNAIENLRAELEDAALTRHQSSRPAVFELNTVEVELDVVAKTTDAVTGKLEYEVVTADMKHEIGSEITHKITLHLTPLPQILLKNATEDKTLDRSDAVTE